MTPKTPEQYFNKAVKHIGKTSRNAYTPLIDNIVENVKKDCFLKFEKKVDELIEKLENQNKLNNLTKFPTGIQQAICELETKQNKKFISDLKILKTE